MRAAMHSGNVQVITWGKVVGFVRANCLPGTGTGLNSNSCAQYPATD